MIRQLKNILKFTLIITIVSTLVLTPLPVSARRHRNEYDVTDNFTFKSFVGDYHITKGENDLAKMHVTETLVAKFPDHDQNHGIKRVIPVTSNGGKNIVVKNPANFEAKVKRNGNDEPYTMDYSDGKITLKIGNSDIYVHGEQTYTIEYDFENVVNIIDLTKTSSNKDTADNDDEDSESTVKEQPKENNDDKNNKDKTVQEVYWNANGNAWNQPFGSVTANVHVDESLISSLYNIYVCYSGAYGEKGKCDVVETEDGFNFSTKNLSRKEGLTFAIAFVDGTFKPAPSRVSYLAYFAVAGMTILFLGTGFFLVNRYKKRIAPKKRYFKNLITATEFTPLKGYTIAEAANLYIKPAQNPKVATVLQMAIQKKIEIIKQEDGKKKLFSKEKWAVKLLDVKNLTEDQKILLQVMNGGLDLLQKDQIIELKSNKATATITALFKSFDERIEANLRDRGDLEPEYKYFANVKWKKVLGIAVPCIIATILLILGLSGQEWFINTFGEYASVAIIENEFLLHGTIYFAAPLYIIMVTCVPSLGSKYMKYTEQGLDRANYLAGLETYIKMAEADRLKFLQSVDGADTTNEGIVKLYETLLPYAIIFGQEKSWLKSLDQYYKLVDEKDMALPVWYAFSNSSFHSLNSSISSSVSLPGSSGGSGFSGGFSGGGGGGGGGGGW